MLDSDYPYTSRNTGRETQCQHDWSKTVGTASNWGQITTTIEDVKAKLEEQPLSVALDASSRAFQNYGSGVIKAGDNCGSSLNHAVVLVGYTDSGNYEPDDDDEDETDNNDNNDNDDNDNDNNDDDEPVSRC